MTNDIINILVISDSEKLSFFIKPLLAAPIFFVTYSSSLNEGLQFMASTNYKIVIIDYDVCGNLEKLLSLSSTPSVILVLTPADIFMDLSYKVAQYGILTLIKDWNGVAFYSMINTCIAVFSKMQNLFNRTIKLKDSIEEIRILQRAKCLLIEHKKISEEAAHRYIEKTAMDRGEKKRVVAERIIQMYA